MTDTPSGETIQPQKPPSIWDQIWTHITNTVKATEDELVSIGQHIDNLAAGLASDLPPSVSAQVKTEVNVAINTAVDAATKAHEAGDDIPETVEVALEAVGAQVAKVVSAVTPGEVVMALENHPDIPTTPVTEPPALPPGAVPEAYQESPAGTSLTDAEKAALNPPQAPAADAAPAGGENDPSDAAPPAAAISGQVGETVSNDGSFAQAAEHEQTGMASSVQTVSE